MQKDISKDVDVDTKTPSKILSLEQYKEKKEISERLTQGRNPLYVSHLTGKIKDTQNFKSPSDLDFADRIQRIKASLERINRLMSDLKKLAQKP